MGDAMRIIGNSTRGVELVLMVSENFPIALLNRNLTFSIPVIGSSESFVFRISVAQLHSPAKL
jgi:hypothetical protein